MILMESSRFSNMFLCESSRFSNILMSQKYYISFYCANISSAILSEIHFLPTFAKNNIALFCANNCFFTVIQYVKERFISGIVPSQRHYADRFRGFPGFRYFGIPAFRGFFRYSDIPAFRYSEGSFDIPTFRYSGIPRVS